MQPDEDGGSPQRYAVVEQNLVLNGKMRGPKVSPQWMAEVLGGKFVKGQFPATYCTFILPSASLVIFPSDGNIQVLGVRSIWDAILVLNYVSVILTNAAGERIVFTDLRLVNTVSSACLGVGVDIGALDLALGLRARHNQDSFSSLVYAMSNTTVTLVVYQTGSVLLTGGKSVEEQWMGLKELFPMMEEFLVDNSNQSQGPTRARSTAERAKFMITPDGIRVCPPPRQMAQQATVGDGTIRTTFAPFSLWPYGMYGPE